MQGYNAQAAVNEHQIVIAAEVTVDSPDFGHLERMVDATRRELKQVGSNSPGVVVADAGYWHKRQMENVGRPPRVGRRPLRVHAPLETETGKALYQQRQTTIEPVFGQMKFNRRLDRFLRRGRSAARSEWRLFTASHNLLKLHNHRTAPAGA